METLGETSAIDAIHKTLTELFPKITEIDMRVVAAKCVDSANMAAVEVANRREDGLQKALSGLMEYYAELLKSNHDRIKELERERAHLHERLAAYQQAEPEIEVASR
jgi:hypothetical protein